MIEKINELVEALNAEAAKEKNGNKSAGARARKLCIELIHNLKAYRQASLQNRGTDASDAE